MRGFKKHAGPKWENRHIPAASEQKISREYAKARRIRSGAAWQKCRNRKIAMTPLCERCGIKLAEEIHHITPLSARPDLAYVMSNLRALCRECHDAEDAGARKNRKIDGRNKEKGLRPDEHNKATGTNSENTGTLT